MSIKTKTNDTTLEKLSDLAGQVGMLLMTGAAVAGMLELPDHPNSRIILPTQPSFAMAAEDDELNNPLRREMEETSPQYISYGASQRTFSRSGKR